MAKKLDLPKLDFKETPKEELPPVVETPVKAVGATVFERMDIRDEQQMELLEKGFIIGEPFYEETSDEDGSIVYGISFIGVTQLARKRGGLEVVGIPVAEHNDTHFAYTVTVKDTMKGVSLFGMGTQKRYTRNGEDPFGRAKALSKAQRNAFRNLLEPQIVEDYFKQWYEATYDAPPSANKIVIFGSSTNLNQYKNGKDAAKG